MRRVDLAAQPLFPARRVLTLEWAARGAGAHEAQSGPDECGVGHMSEPSTSAVTSTVVDDTSARRLRRAELLVERQRAAARRRQRGFGLRLPTSKPLVFLPAARAGDGTAEADPH